ncbi:MAG: hypothetical protein QNL12_12805 [Acidimicrobiia bacterium]|nr:hypothetical protein [Acidimicrobiia bacterium]MDX2468190.1 hypothetical protein [Acidimicrobiia bacterium]
MNVMHLWKPDDRTRERLLRWIRIVLLISLLPWIVTGLRPFESARFLMQLGVGAVAAIVAVKYYRRRMNARVRARFTEGRSMPVRAVAKFVLGYGEVLAGFYAMMAVLGIFGVIELFIQ